MFKTTKETSKRVSVEYGEHIILTADAERHANFITWRGELYNGECFAIIPMKPSGVDWLKYEWRIMYLDYEGNPAEVVGGTFFDALNYCDKHAEQMLRGYLIARGVLHEGEEVDIK